MFLIVCATLIASILLLRVPVHLVFAVRKEEEWRGSIVVYWLFGLVRTKLRLGRAPKKRRALLRKAGGWLAGKRQQLLSMLRSEGFVQHLARFVLKLTRTMRPRRFQLQCVIGLDDPADTGRLLAVLVPVRFLLKKIAVGQDSYGVIRIIPDFSGPRFTGYCCTSVHVVPLKLIGIFLAFSFSAPVLRAARTAFLGSKD